MKRITKQMPMDFIEFDDGTLVSKNEFIDELFDASTMDYTAFDMTDPADINKYNFIKSHCDNYNPIRSEKKLNNRELEVEWKSNNDTREFFYELIDILTQMEKEGE